MKSERIGVFGGTFHPIHNGHLLLAEHAICKLSLDRVLFVIDRVPPHKEIAGGASTEDRLNMLRLALDGKPNFTEETIELSREGKSYTFDTLTELHNRMPGADLFFLMGSDMLRSFSDWYNPQGISDLASLVCIERVGQAGAESETASELHDRFHSRVILLEGVSDLSSTDVRNRIRAAKPIHSEVPRSVARYIYEKGLYQPVDIVSIYRKLQKDLTSSRMRHTSRVLETALTLAERYEVDPVQTRVAALLHDCAKCLSPEELIAQSDDSNPILPVLHAEVGAKLAAERYGVKDPAVLQAIRLHTTGDAGMSVLDKIIYLADMIEPERDYPGVEAIRSENDLDSAVLLALQRSLVHIKERGFPIHPATLRAINSLGGNL